MYLSCQKRQAASIKNNVSLAKHFTLFLSTLQLIAMTFGGGFVIIPLMRRKFVEQLHWIDEQEMLDFIAIAQSSPGAMAVNVSVLVGYRVAGVSGALVTVLGTILPPLAIISVISLFYMAFRDNRIVSMAMAGMLAGVAAVIVNAVIDLVRGVIKSRRALPIVVMVLAIIAARWLKVNVLIFILICGIIGAIDTLRQRKEANK